MTSEYYQNSFHHVNLTAPPAASENSDISETDFEDDSEIGDLSPRFSFNSTWRRSETTISSFDGVHTPNSNGNKSYKSSCNTSVVRSVEGPQGPHLFQSSLSPTVRAKCNSGEEYDVRLPRFKSKLLSRSTTMTKESSLQPKNHSLSFPDATVDHVSFAEILWWTPRKVSEWLCDEGFESSIAEKFEANDISGLVLTTLKFEDLKELGILSFGQRTKIWDKINFLRKKSSEVTSIVKTIAPLSVESKEQVEHHPVLGISRTEHKEPCYQNSFKKHHRKYKEETTRQLEPISIVGIEQLLPKPHWCTKGENCSKWKKQQRLIENMKREHSIDLKEGWSWFPGESGGMETSGTTIARYPACNTEHFVSASSNFDNLTPPSTRLKEESLRNIESLDPQESVKQFIHHQHVDKQTRVSSVEQTEVSKTPISQPSTGLRKGRSPSASSSQARMINQASLFHHQMERAAPESSELPYSIPSTFPREAVPVPAIAQDASQPAPPNMLNMHVPTCASTRYPFSQNLHVSDTIEAASHAKNEINHACEILPVPADQATHTGWMMKRKTKMLRHKWHLRHFTLKGTQLTMRKDDCSLDTLEYIDIDDFAIACSSFASSSKLAFKAMLISRDKQKNQIEKDAAAFAFQLIPATILDKGTILRQRTGAAAFAALVTGRSTTENNFSMKNKTHHFAVRSRDERIDWMRELMLAKALSQKSRGYEVNVNGNLI